MNNKITNPFLKKLISEISNKASDGRITDITWGSLNEAKKKGIKKEAVEKKKKVAPPVDADPNAQPQEPDAAPTEAPPETPGLPETPPAKDTQAAGLGDVPSTEQAPAEIPPAEAAPADAAPEEAPAQDVDQAKADATKAKAELEKAKAEKDQAEQEIEDQSHVKLVSQAGVTFLLTKIVTSALQSNSIDAVAGEMVDKLNIKTPEDFALLVDEMAPFRIIPGVGELLASMKDLIGKSPAQPENPDETPAQ